MADLQSQLDKLQKLIELKNNQLAKMQAQGAGAAPGDAAAVPAVPAITAELAATPPATPAEAAPTPESAIAPPSIRRLSRLLNRNRLSMKRKPSTNC